MVKLPVAGRVKTRLAQQVGLARAVGFYRHSTRAVLDRVGHDTRWQTWLSVAPDSAVTSGAWSSALMRVAQGRGDLGLRMQRIFAVLPPGPVVVVGSDVPGITAMLIAAAFRALRQHSVVLGPAEDGGFWLVGMRRSGRVPQAFQNVRWSSADTLADTMANLDGCRVGLVARLNDVDDAADLARAASIAGRRVPPR
jgi:rSAM/selenodomain-associated transferase 1